MTQKQINATLAASVLELTKEARLLKRAIEIIQENPRSLEEIPGLTVQPDDLIRVMEQAHDQTTTRIAGLGIAALLVPEDDSADA